MRKKKIIFFHKTNWIKWHLGLFHKINLKRKQKHIFTTRNGRHIRKEITYIHIYTSQQVHNLSTLASRNTILITRDIKETFTNNLIFMIICFEEFMSFSIDSLIICHYFCVVEKKTFFSAFSFAVLFYFFESYMVAHISWCRP